jgi:hypothetical protein
MLLKYTECRRTVVPVFKKGKIRETSNAQKNNPFSLEWYLQGMLSQKVCFQKLNFTLNFQYLYKLTCQVITSVRYLQSINQNGQDTCYRKESC